MLPFLINIFIYPGSGLAFLIGVQSGFLLFLVMTGMTIIFNLVTATLITFRILYFDRYIRKTVGLECNNPYTTVIILCVESSALIVVIGSIYFSLEFRTTNKSLIPLQLLVHVYVRIYVQEKERNSLKFSYRSYLHFSSSIELPGAELPLSTRDLRKIGPSYHH